MALSRWGHPCHANMLRPGSVPTSSTRASWRWKAGTASRAVIYRGIGPDGQEQPLARSWSSLEGATNAGLGDILTIRPGVDTVPVPLAADPDLTEYSPALSPNGRWLAYVSNKDGPEEVFVRPFRFAPTHSASARGAPRGGIRLPHPTTQRPCRLSWPPAREARILIGFHVLADHATDEATCRR